MRRSLDWWRVGGGYPDGTHGRIRSGAAHCQAVSASIRGSVSVGSTPMPSCRWAIPPFLRLRPASARRPVPSSCLTRLGSSLVLAFGLGDGALGGFEADPGVRAVAEGLLGGGAATAEGHGLPIGDVVVRAIGIGERKGARD